MDEIELKNCTVRKRQCEKVIWNNIPVGLIFAEEDGTWRLTTDLKGEFWALAVVDSKDSAIRNLIQKRQELDEYRVNLLQSNSVK
ncbi:MAG: hypothetical protein NE327_19915 [Lentisphaeraceae bacterium]|nr:hypothetical protein [Lentisphaeraceae bacterium]